MILSAQKAASAIDLPRVVPQDQPQPQDDTVGPSQTALPFVSAVCVTGQSDERTRRWLPIAWRAFYEQTYPTDRREFVVVTHGSRWPAERALRGFSLPRELTKLAGESFYRLFTIQRQPLGQMRNMGLAVATGDYIMPWDDDDWSDRQRMMVQVIAAMHWPGTAVCLKRTLAYDWASNTAISREFHNTSIHPSVLHPRTEGRYRAVEQGEDTSFLQDHFPQHVVLQRADPRLMVRFAHGANVSTRQHILQGWDEPWALSQWHLGDEHRAYLKEVIAKCEEVWKCLGV